MKSEFDDNIASFADGTNSKGKVNQKTEDEVRKAYQVIGVREGASREEIERRYYILAKKHLILQRENVKSEVVGLNMEKINEAYYLLISLGSHDAGELCETDGDHQKLIPHIWKNYRKAIIIAIIVLIGSIVLFFSTENNNNISIVFFGEFENSYEFIRTLKNRNTNNEIMSQKEVIIQEFILSDDIPLPYKIDMMSAAYNFVTQGNYHVLIMDKESFEEYGAVANIAKLDNLVKELGLDDKSCFTIKKQGIDEAEHIYGLNASYLNNRYNLTEAETSYIIAIRDGLNSDTIKSVIETVRLLMN